MYNDIDIKDLIHNSSLPEGVKIAVSFILKAITWFPWVFVGIGILLDKEYFIYWFMFFLAIYALLCFVFLHMLLIIFKTSLSSSVSPEPEEKEGVVDAVWKNIVIKIFSYLVPILALIAIQLFGIPDSVKEFLSTTINLK